MAVTAEVGKVGFSENVVDPGGELMIRPLMAEVAMRLASQRAWSQARLLRFVEYQPVILCPVTCGFSRQCGR